MQGEPVSGQLHLTGSFDRRATRWKGVLDNTRFSTPVGPLVLSRSIALDYRNAEQKLSIGPHCWTNPNAELCVPQTIDAGAEGRAQINLNRFDGDAETVYAGNHPGQRGLQRQSGRRVGHHQEGLPQEALRSPGVT